MEHRNGSRVSASLPVEILHDNKSYGCFMAHNLSHGGLFLDCCGMFKKGDFLTVKITSNSDEPPSYYFVKVMVIHSSEQGLGLIWADYNLPFFNALDFMLSTRLHKGIKNVGIGKRC